MLYYIVILIFICLLTVLFKKKYGLEFIKSNKKYLIIITIILMLFLVLKDTSVGVDTGNYEKIFNYSHEKSFIELLNYGRHEIGFKYYAKIISLIFNNYYFFLVITSILSMVGFYFYTRDNSENYFVTIFIFVTFNYYIYLFGLLRQALAISVLLYSIKFIKEKQLLKFLIAVLFASLFHKTALIFLPLYFLKNVKIDRKKLILWLIIIGTLLIFKDFVLKLIFDYIYTPSRLETTNGGGYKMLLLLFGASIVCYFYQNELTSKNNHMQLFINMTYIATLIQVLATYFGMAFRVTLYFAFSLIILIPNILNIIKNVKLRKFIYILMIVSLGAYYIYSINDSSFYVDYNFVFLK